MVKGQWQLSILEKGQVFQVKWGVDSLLVKIEGSPLISKYLSFFFFFFSKRLCESCRYISKLRHEYFFLSFKNLQLPQKFLNLRKFSDFLHFSVDILVNLLWLSLYLKLGSKLSLNLILKKSTFGCMNDSNALLPAVLLFYYFFGFHIHPRTCTTGSTHLRLHLQC